jgi:hypothetical protein
MELTELKNKLASALVGSDLQNLNTLSEEAMQLYPDEGFGYYYLGEKLLLEASNDMPSIEWAFAKASYLDQSNITYLKRFAKSLDEQFKYEEAANVYATIYYIDSQDDDALFGLGRHELSDIRKNPSAALQYFARIATPNADVYEGMALAYMGLEDFDLALGMIDYALSLGFDVESAIAKIQILDKMQSYVLIPAVFEQILELEPNNFGFQFEYAVALKRADEYEDANQAFLKAYVLMPENTPFDIALYRPYIENCLSLAAYNEALDAANKCIENAPQKDAYLHELKAKALAGTGDNAAALKEWDTIIDMYSFNPLLQQIATVGKIELMANIGDIDAAEKGYNALEKEFEKEKNPPKGLMRDIAFGRAVIALKKGNFELAYLTALKALQLGLEKAKDFILKNLLDYLAQSRQTILAAHSGIDKNKENAFLTKVIGKAWAFNQFKLPVPEQFASDAEKKKQFEDSVAKFQETLPQFAMVIGEKEIFLDIPFSNPKKPIRSFVYAYEVEKGKENLLQLKLYAIDGTEELTAKLKVEDDSIVFSLVEGEIFRLEEIKDLSKVSYKTQRNFVKHLGYLNLLNRYELEGNTRSAIDALLDY